MTSSVNSEFYFSEDFEVDKAVLNAWDVNGYVVLKNLLSPGELSRLKEGLESPDGVMKHAWEREDGYGLKIKLASWSHPGNDVTGMVSRSEKVAGTFEKLLGGEVYHYHSKVILKAAKSGGRHVWHQDYGYWYQYGNMYPRMGTVWIAVDKATKTNGCVQLLGGSHQLGRLEHVVVGQQVGADPDRVKHAEKLCPLVYAELDPGDAIFFHCNVLHQAAPNLSDERRWGYLCCYNRADNNPVIKHYHPFYTPLSKVPSSAIVSAPLDALEGKDFEESPVWRKDKDFHEQTGTHEN